MNRIKKIFTILLSAFLWIVAVCLVTVVIGISYWFYNTKPVTSAAEEYAGKINVPAGTSVRLVAETLEKEKFIRSAKVFYLAVRFNLFNRNRIGQTHMICKSKICTRNNCNIIFLNQNLCHL